MRINCATQLKLRVKDQVYECGIRRRYVGEMLLNQSWRIMRINTQAT